MRGIATIAGLSLLAAAAGALPVMAQTGSLLARYPLSAESSQQWRLPKRLKEISGLALTGDQRLLAVDDEHAIVYELDYEDGRLVKAFALGDPTLRGDFEGIAWLDNRIYLVTSDGTVYATGEGSDGERVPFEKYRTGLGRDCEIEGLAADAGAQALLLLCKRSLARSGRGAPSIFVWSTADRTVEWTNRIELPLQAIAAEIRSGTLHPSGIARAGTAGHWLIIAAREKALVEIDANGALVAARVLPLADRHRQAEGIEWLPDGRLLIADEGGDGPARLAVYRPGDDAGEGAR